MTERIFIPSTSQFTVPGTSYKIQIGLIEGKWALRLLKGKEVIDSYVFKDEDVQGDFPNQNIIVGRILRTLAIPNINPHLVMKTTQALVKQAIQKKEHKRMLVPLPEYKTVELEPFLDNQLKRQGLLNQLEKARINGEKLTNLSTKALKSKRSLQPFTKISQIDDSFINLSNKDRILNLLKTKALTSKKIAKILDLSEQDTRTYLLRLKKEDRIKHVGKKGRYYIYTYKKAYDSEKNHSIINALEYDLSYLLNLVEMKMTLKEGEELSPSDLTIIGRIKDKLADKKEDIKRGVEVLSEYVNYEKRFRNEINAKIAELEARINSLAPKVVKKTQPPTIRDRYGIGFKIATVEDGNETFDFKVAVDTEEEPEYMEPQIGPEYEGTTMDQELLKSLSNETILLLLEKTGVPEGYERKMVIVNNKIYAYKEIERNFLGSGVKEKKLFPLKEKIQDGPYLAENYVPRMLFSSNKIVLIDILQKVED